MLIECNRNPITLLNFCEKCINCKCGQCMEHGRSVNEGLWIAFVKTQRSSDEVKVRLCAVLMSEEIKLFYFLENVMIWIKIVRLAVRPYHRAGVLWPFQVIVIFWPCDASKAPLLLPCNWYWVLLSILHCSQPITWKPTWGQHSSVVRAFAH